MEGKFYVWKGKFAVAKAKKALPGAFAVIRDKNEITVIIDESNVRAKTSKEITEVERDWKIITFDMVLPFGLVGFLSKISKALADEKISIFAVSAYSTDHVLVREKDLPKAVRKLESLGFRFRKEKV